MNKSTSVVWKKESPELVTGRGGVRGTQNLPIRIDLILDKSAGAPAIEWNVYWKEDEPIAEGRFEFMTFAGAKEILETYVNVAINSRK